MSFPTPQNIILLGVVVSAIGAIIGGIGVYLNSKQENVFKDQVINLQMKLQEKAEENQITQAKLVAKAEEQVVLQGELKKKSDELVDSSLTSLNTITGGTSFPFISFGFTSNPNIFDVVASTKGGFPLYDIHVEMWEQNSPSKRTHRDLGNLAPNVAKPLSTLFVGDGTSCRFIMTIHARNGWFTQITVFKKVLGKWTYASIVNKSDPGKPHAVLMEYVPKEFPLDEKGVVAWER